MARLQTIENRLSELGGNEFQELCDMYLQRKNKTYRTFARTGSMIGKKQTTKGTPDSFFLLPNGNYIFVEHTTNTSQKDKLEKDILSCLNTKATKIPLDKIQEIILCTTRKLTIEKIDNLKVLLKHTKISLKIYQIQEVANDLMLHHNDLVYQCLDLPLDTGQIVSIDRFIQEYEKVSKGIATPLTNKFFHRDKETEDIVKSINDYDFTMLYGNAGIGKTKLALEAVNIFLGSNINYQAFCISYKNTNLVKDLHQYFISDEDYILFVDDANRIDSFDQILGFYKNIREGKLKIILTVRDYAFPEFSSRCLGFSMNSIKIHKLNNEQLKDILESESIEITNPEYQREILRIADGNPRFALMASKLALDKQDIRVLSDVTDLFDTYFSTFTKDYAEFADGLSLKYLGLIAFFHTLPYNDNAVMTAILNLFGLELNDFIEKIDRLNRLELVEIQYDYVKIPEQNLATYFFYKVFIKDELLSFKTLLFTYYEENSRRFLDTVIPANNTFNHEKVMKKVTPILKEYIQTLNLNNESIPQLYSDFWFYLQDETLGYIYNLIENLPISQNPEYKTDYERNDFVFKKNSIIALLREYFIVTDKLIDAIDLSFEYIKRKPENLPELIYSIVNYLTFTHHDFDYGFGRQKVFIDWLLDKMSQNENEILYTETFYTVINNFLKFQYRYQGYGGKNTVSLMNFTLKISPEVEKIREKIWQTLYDRFDIFPEKSKKVLKKYDYYSHDFDKKLVEFDIDYILSIIENKLDDELFEDCHYVHRQLEYWEKENITNSKFGLLKNQFTNTLYDFYSRVTWNRYQNKLDYEYDNWKEFETLKEQEIRNSFIVNSIQEFETVYKNLLYLYQWDKSASNNFEWSIKMIIDENIIRNPHLRLEILEFIVKQGNEVNYRPYTIFDVILKDSSEAENIYNLISNTEFKQKRYWLFMYFEYLDNSLIGKKQYERLVHYLRSINDSLHIHFQHLIRYEQIEANLLRRVLQIIVSKIENGIFISLEHDFYPKYLPNLEHDLTLVRKSYIQQDKLSRIFDRDSQGFLSILKHDSNFLLEYVQEVIEKQATVPSASGFRNLSIIWELNNINDLLRNIINWIVDNTYYIGVLEHFATIFFKKLYTKEQRKSVNEFIEYYIQNENSNHRKMNVIFSIVRQKVQGLFEDSILQYLSLNQSLEDFKNISWQSSGGTISGNVNWGDIRASKWQNLLSIVEKSKVGYKLIPIKKYIQDCIDEELKYAETEKKRRFLNSDF